MEHGGSTLAGKRARGDNGKRSKGKGKGKEKEVEEVVLDLGASRRSTMTGTMGMSGMRSAENISRKHSSAPLGGPVLMPIEEQKAVLADRRSIPIYRGGEQET